MWLVGWCFFVPHVSEFDRLPFRRVWYLAKEHCGGVGGVQVGVVEHPGGGWFCAWSPADPGLVFRGESLTEAVGFLVKYSGSRER